MPETVPPQDPLIIRLPLIKFYTTAEGKTVGEVIGSTPVPPGEMNGRYLGPNGYTTSIADATDFRGEPGKNIVQGQTVEVQGPKGDPGADGKSALVIWQEQGNSGGTAAFLASLKGTQGDQGTQGLKGDKGETGDTGLRGEQGATGVVGPAGPTGAKGDTGLTGATGPKGDTGPAGQTGATGPAGAKGDTGSTGAQGPQGLKGDTGAQGVKGDTGAAGETLVAQINVTETVSLAVVLGLFENRYPCPGAVVGERYKAYIRSYAMNGTTTKTPGRPAGFYAVAADCMVAGTMNVVYQRPNIALAIPPAKYELFTDIVKANAS